MTDDEPRTPLQNPGERVTDKDFWGKLDWWWSPSGGRGYRDIWLIVITGLALYGLILLGDRQDEITATRATNIQTSCVKSNENSEAINSVVTALQKIIVSGSVLPGDVPSPQSKDPMKWETIEPGPLSRQIKDIAPSFPDATQRLKDNKATAATLDDEKVANRNCDKEVQTVKENG